MSRATLTAWFRLGVAHVGVIGKKTGRATNGQALEDASEALPTVAEGAGRRVGWTGSHGDERGVLIFIFSIPLVYSLTRVPAEWHSLIQEEREERAVAVIHSRGGEATYEELSDALGISRDEVDAVLVKLVETGRIADCCEVKCRCFYSTTALEKKQRRLLEIVKARGQVSLEELAAELTAPQGLVSDWLYGLVQRGTFSGYVNWDDGMLYSAEAKKPRKAGNCPGCGSQMGPGGRGVIHCEHCGLEIFL